MEGSAGQVGLRKIEINCNKNSGKSAQNRYSSCSNIALKCCCDDDNNNSVRVDQQRMSTPMMAKGVNGVYLLPYALHQFIFSSVVVALFMFFFISLRRIKMVKLIRR